MPETVAVTFVTVPGRPETVMVEGYGEAAAGPLPDAGTVNGLALEKVDCAASGVAKAANVATGAIA